ncbi:hypothetical protein [Veillonella rodentium]|nr:hypothetical protein [Veillonella rodentium]
MIRFRNRFSMIRTMRFVKATFTMTYPAQFWKYLSICMDEI